ncbi:Putative methyltransferase [Chondromyces apiculatus DSM 436]|uniref:Methyltransferase n=1 Tax=Chondromyces apiculatus DSM 436 TaxID=1192034 RepID=A0A017SV98_9BACT|nr:Putative methyltransferase [Chondromyces apiculatus DSM 436]
MLPAVPRPSQRDLRPTLVLGDALDHYGAWPSPTVIVSDGAYGVSGFPGDPPTPDGLADWYAPHVEAWSRRALPSTTLWFWNTEIGWALVHPLLAQHGWEYRTCHIWDKGIAHIAGNANTRTLRKFPVVTEVCAHYVREVKLDAGGVKVPMKAWLRQEWERSGLPIGRTNEACGVKNAATRKYFTRCHLWYCPPAEAFERLVAFANTHGRPEGRPYFTVDGRRSLTGEEWAGLRSKFHCEVGVTNVWHEPAVRGAERFKSEARALHGNQKPLKLLDRIIRASSDPGDVVWEPFGGLCSAAVAAFSAGRACYSAEIASHYHGLAVERLARVAFREAPLHAAAPRPARAGVRVSAA